MNSYANDLELAVQVGLLRAALILMLEEYAESEEYATINAREILKRTELS